MTEVNIMDGKRLQPDRAGLPQERHRVHGADRDGPEGHGDRLQVGAQGPGPHAPEEHDRPGGPVA